MIRSLFAVGALALLSAACGAPVVVAPPPPAPPPGPPALAVLDDAAGAERIRHDIGYLASDELGGRGTGEPGAALAAQMIADRFAKLGLQPLGDADAGGIRGYRQAFLARYGVKAGYIAFAWQRKGGPAATGPAPDDAPRYVTADGSASGTARGAPVLVGYGISAPALGWDDYAGADLHGKIAIVLEGTPPAAPTGKNLRDFGSTRYKLRAAREHGAAGVIVLVRSHLMQGETYDSSDMRIPGIVMTTEEAGASLLPTVADELARKRAIAAAHTPEAQAKARASRYDDTHLWEEPAPKPAKPLSRDEIEFTTHVQALETQTWNVAALLPARADAKSAREYVVVGAHYDHLGHGGTPSSRAPGSHEIHHGADDNASGVALMLEVAARLRGLPRGLDRGVVFIAFGGEEIGLLGSRWFVDHSPVPVAAIDAMINADMVGRLRNDDLVLDGVGTADGWQSLIDGASRGLGLRLHEGKDGFGASDHTSFTVARVPVAFLFTGVHDDYHKPSDTADKINAAGEERIATLAARLALQVAEQRERLVFVDPKPDPHGGGGAGGGFRVSLGTLPDYAFNGPGVRLTGARPDSPASRAGIAAGDVIVKVGVHEVGNIHDYMFALGELEPGREVEIVVERAGKRVPLKVIPAPPR